MLEKAFIIAFAVIAIWATMLPGMLFSKIRDLLPLNRFWRMPVYDCPICMGFWHGSLLYYLIYGNSISEWAIVVLVAMGVLAVFVKLLPE